MKNKSIKLTARYELVNKFTGEKQGYYAFKNEKGLTEDMIRAAIYKSINKGLLSSAMIMINRKVIVYDYKGRIHYSFNY